MCEPLHVMNEYTNGLKQDFMAGDDYSSLHSHLHYHLCFPSSSETISSSFSLCFFFFFLDSKRQLFGWLGLIQSRICACRHPRQTLHQNGKLYHCYKHCHHSWPHIRGPHISLLTRGKIPKCKLTRNSIVL